MPSKFLQRRIQFVDEQINSNLQKRNQRSTQLRKLFKIKPKMAALFVINQMINGQQKSIAAKMYKQIHQTSMSSNIVVLPHKYSKIIHIVEKQFAPCTSWTEDTLTQLYSCIQTCQQVTELDQLQTTACQFFFKSQKFVYDFDFGASYNSCFIQKIQILFKFCLKNKLYDRVTGLSKRIGIPMLQGLQIIYILPKFDDSRVVINNLYIIISQYFPISRIIVGDFSNSNKLFDKDTVLKNNFVKYNHYQRLDKNDDLFGLILESISLDLTNHCSYILLQNLLLLYQKTVDLGENYDFRPSLLSFRINSESGYNSMVSKYKTCVLEATVQNFNLDPNLVTFMECLLGLNIHPVISKDNLLLFQRFKYFVIQ